MIYRGHNPASGSGEYRRYIGGVAIATFFEASGVDRQRYLHTDHIGSTTAITDENGQVVANMAFDAWGERRRAADWNERWVQWLMGATPAWAQSAIAITPRGFTGHEHVDSMGIIHMNGRIYDAHLGRFLQADPFVEDSTTLNRYTYVHNNPLALTDPSGFFSFGKAFRTIASIGIAVGAGILTAGAGFTLQGFLYATLGGALSGGIAAGSIEGALWGAFSGAVFFGLGAGFDQLAQANVAAVNDGGLSAGKLVFNTNLKAGQFAAQSVSHGIAGGTIAEMQGGKFGHGFISAGVSKAATPGITSSSLNTFQQGAVLAIVGGSVSRVTGGKFANGATTAAMAFAFNEIASGDAEFEREFDTDDPNYHFYDIEGAICEVDSVCSLDSVANASLMHPAPGTFSRTTPVRNGETSTAQLGYDFELDDFGPVLHTVSGDGLVVRNTALPGHRLFPGFVERRVFSRGDTIFIRTIGEGVGPMGGLNQRFAGPLWNGVVNSHVRYRVNLGFRQ